MKPEIVSQQFTIPVTYYRKEPTDDGHGARSVIDRTVQEITVNFAGLARKLGERACRTELPERSMLAAMWSSVALICHQLEEELVARRKRTDPKLVALREEQMKAAEEFERWYARCKRAFTRMDNIKKKLVRLAKRIEACQTESQGM